MAAARERGLIPPRPRAAADATGLEARYSSGYYAWRSGRRHHRRWWPKLTAVADTASHVLLSAHVTRGPGPDAPQFRPVVRAAVRRCPLDTLLADAAFDAEAHHAYAREALGVRATVIPLCRRSHGRKRPKTEYRRQMVRRFRAKPKGSRSRRVYGQRWQVESVFSRHKRRLGAALRARRWVNQKAEVLLRVLTHNLMLLAAR